ncbi:MAG: 4a-hydroxytetrahydrobiopterin dehydratase [Acidimicrobiales bacterium]
MRDPRLADDELAELLEGPEAPDWQLVGGRLMKTVRCHGFAGALAFVSAVGALAEAADHHPDIDIRYNRVTLSLITHDSDGITRRDVDLARKIDAVTDGLE